MNTCFNTLNLPKVLISVIRDYACFEVHFTGYDGKTKYTAIVIPGAHGILKNQQSVKNSLWVYNQPCERGHSIRVTPSGGFLELYWEIACLWSTLYDAFGKQLIHRQDINDQAAIASSTHIFVRQVTGQVMEISSQGVKQLFECQGFVKFIAANDKYLVWQDDSKILNFWNLDRKSNTRFDFDCVQASFCSFDSDLFCILTESRICIVNMSARKLVEQWDIPPCDISHLFGFR